MWNTLTMPFEWKVRMEYFSLTFSWKPKGWKFEGQGLGIWKSKVCILEIGS